MGYNPDHYVGLVFLKEGEQVKSIVVCEQLCKVAAHRQEVQLAGSLDIKIHINRRERVRTCWDIAA